MNFIGKIHLPTDHRQRTTDIIHAVKISIN